MTPLPTVPDHGVGLAPITVAGDVGPLAHWDGPGVAVLVRAHRYEETDDGQQAVLTFYDDADQVVATLTPATAVTRSTELPAPRP